jgi:hypothetical protein
MLTTLGRLSDEDLPIEPQEAPVMRDFFGQWVRDLAGSA